MCTHELRHRAEAIRIKVKRMKIIRNEKEYTFHKYENAKGGKRWAVDCDGKEIAHDFTTRKNAINYVQSHK